MVGRLVSDHVNGELENMSILVVKASDEVIHPISEFHADVEVSHSLPTAGCRLADRCFSTRGGHLRGCTGEGESRTPKLAAEMGTTVAGRQQLPESTARLRAAGPATRHLPRGWQGDLCRVALPIVGARGRLTPHCVQRGPPRGTC